jgi:hypothetical protein
MTDTIQDIDFTATFLDAILWQYNNSPNLLSIVEQKDTWYQENQVQFWQNWITDIFDIRTCNQFGLAVWSIILNIPLHVATQASASGPKIGFGVLNQNFFKANFGSVSSSGVSLSIESQRILLLLRYAQLTGRTEVPWINQMLSRILGTFGKVYVLDPLDMSSLTYVVTFQPSSELWFILTECDVLPRPAGVGLKIIVSGFKSFGFGTFNQNFGNGNLINPIIEVF